MASSAAMFERTYAALVEEFESVRRQSDSNLLHDQLEEVNDPVYFHEFVERAAAKGLQFMSEVQGNLVALESLPHRVGAGLRELAADRLELEQFLDILINRKFRQSVLCRAGMALRRDPRREDLATLEVAAPRSDAPLPVPLRNERRLRTALEHLARIWPLTAPWTALARLAEGCIETPPADFPGEQDLASDLLACYNLKVVEFWTYKPPYVLEIGERPLASPLARHQAAVGKIVTNLRHEAGQVNDFSRIVLRHLDGHHDRSALLRVLHQSRKEGRLVSPGIALPPVGDSPGLDREAQLEREFGSRLDRCLRDLARFALLLR
jgi:hypothetical protein